MGGREVPPGGGPSDQQQEHRRHCSQDSQDSGIKQDNQGTEVTVCPQHSSSSSYHRPQPVANTGPPMAHQGTHILSLALPIPVRMGMSIDSETSDASLPGSTPTVRPPAACGQRSRVYKQGNGQALVASGRNVLMMRRRDAGNPKM